MICPQCNYRGEDGDKWCPKCGSPMQEERDTGTHSLEESLKIKPSDAERKRKADEERQTLDRIKIGLKITGVVLICLAMMHFCATFWSIMYKLYEPEESNYLLYLLRNAANGHMGRVIVYNTGDILHTNKTLMFTEIMMGIMQIVVAFMCFSADWNSLQKRYYKTVPCTLFFTYLAYTGGVILSYMGIGDSWRAEGYYYKEVFDATYVGYIVAAIIVTIIVFVSYSSRKKGWEYLTGKAKAPARNVPIVKSEFENPPAPQTQCRSVGQTVRPIMEGNTLKCPLCGESGQNNNRSCCWQCGAKFIK